MTRHEKFLAQLAELAHEYEEKLRPEEMVQRRLRWEDWVTLRPEAVVFAKEEIRRRRWRGRRGGMLPEGYDAEAVANQAIEEMLEGTSRLVIGFTRERIVNELKRLVSRRVRALHKLSEAKAVRSEWEGENGDEDGEGQGASLLAGVPAESEGADEAMCREEEESWREGVIRGFEKLLEPEREVQAIFRCLCAGMNESKEIARRLGIEEAAVVKGRKKLVRRAGEFERRVKGKGKAGMTNDE